MHNYNNSKVDCVIQEQIKKQQKKARILIEKDLVDFREKLDAYEVCKDESRSLRITPIEAQTVLHFAADFSISVRETFLKSPQSLEHSAVFKRNDSSWVAATACRIWVRDVL